MPGAGRFLGELFRERPPSPLDSMSVASDVRIDSLGYLVGSFVGEGTSRAVHLLSSDTGLVAALVRRYRPDLRSAGTSLWGPLAREGVVTLAPAGAAGRTTGTPRIERALVGSPLGQTAVTSHAPFCCAAAPAAGGEPRSRSSWITIAAPEGPPLRGPVLGSFTRTDSVGPRTECSGFAGGSRCRRPGTGAGGRADRPNRQGHGLRARRPLPVARAAAARTIRGSRSTRSADVDAADVIAFRSGAGEVRFAVSLRERRITARRRHAAGRHRHGLGQRRGLAADDLSADLALVPPRPPRSLRRPATRHLLAPAPAHQRLWIRA